jgi:hypothetical protein
MTGARRPDNFENGSTRLHGMFTAIHEAGTIGSLHGDQDVICGQIGLFGKQFLPFRYSPSPYRSFPPA